jgi:LysM repeat protein
MSDAQRLSDPYRVQSGDTLGRIASRCGQPLSALQKRNHLQDVNRLEVGQTLYLSDETAFGVSVLFLDALRHPIQNLPFKLEYDGKAVSGKTESSGLVPQHITQSAKSEVKVWVQTVEGTWQQVTRTVSDYGHKLITLVSDAVVVSGKTEALPHGVDPKPQGSVKSPATTPGKAQAAKPKSATGKSTKNNPAVKTKKIKGPKGEPILKIEVDIPQGLLDLFSFYTGAPIVEKDWQTAADGLQCESAVLKAFSEVESGGRSSFWRLNKSDGAHIPALLFERHYFSKLTKGAHDKTHPDISWPVGYQKQSRLGKEDKHMHDGKVDADDVYADFASAYLRLINAYRLNADAALASCSWGKFQIMGANFESCGVARVGKFVELMCTSEFEQIKLVTTFVRNKPAVWKNRKNHKLGKHPSLWDSIKSKDWAMIALNYNGPGYKTYNYDAKLKAAYDKYKALEKSASA